MYQDPETQAFLEWLAGAELPPLIAYPPAEGRRQFDLRSKKADILPSEVGACKDIAIPGPGGELPLRLYWPPGGDHSQSPVLVFFHGGGFVFGGLESYDNLCRALCRGAQCLVVSVDYRLAPEHRYPAAVEDSCAAMDWVTQNIAVHGGDPSRIAVAGDSAGGTLAAFVAQQRNKYKLVHQVLIYPCLDQGGNELAQLYPSRETYAQMFPVERETIDWFTRQYFGPGAAATEPRAAPIRERNLTGLPPALVITAGLDPLRDEGKHYADSLKDSGVPIHYHCFEGTLHGFISMGGVLSLAHQALHMISSTLRQAFTDAQQSKASTPS